MVVRGYRLGGGGFIKVISGWQNISVNPPLQILFNKAIAFFLKGHEKSDRGLFYPESAWQLSQKHFYSSGQA
ncbi:hypothetical protein QUB13_14260 [Microcoleus sp. B4-D4]